MEKINRKDIRKGDLIREIVDGERTKAVEFRAKVAGDVYDEGLELYLLDRPEPAIRIGTIVRIPPTQKEEGDIVVKFVYAPRDIDDYTPWLGITPTSWKGERFLHEGDIWPHVLEGRYEICDE